jgi:hypothetical protein
MTQQSTADEPWHRRFTTQRALRGLEAVTHLTTAAAFVLTVVLVSTGVASEANLVTAELLSTAGWTATGLLALAVATVTFAYLQCHRETAPRAVAVGALLLAGLGAVDLAVNVWTLSQVGWPESMLVRVWAPGAVVAVAAVVAILRREIAGGLRAPRRWTPAWTPSPQATAAVAFALLLVVSGMGPLVGFGVVETDHDGTAAAASTLEETYNIHNDDIRGLTVYEDDIFTASDDGNVNRTDISTGTVEQTYNLHSARVVDAVIYNGDLFTASWDNTIKRVDISTGDVLQTYSHHGDRVRGMEVQNGSIFSASEDGTAAKVDIETGTVETEYTSADATTMYDITPYEGDVFVGDNAQELVQYDMSSGDVKNTYAAASGVTQVDAAAGYVFHVDQNTEVVQREISTGNEINSYTDAENWNDIQSFPEYDRVLLGTWQEARLLNASDGTKLETYTTDNNFEGFDIYNAEVYAGVGDGSVERYSDTQVETLGHPISGTVTDHAGNPVDGATVSTGTGVSTTTVSDGSYELTVENTGTYDVTAETAIDTETQTVDVPDGGVTGVDFALQSGTVAGVVEDQNGNPVSNATVTTLTYNTKDPNVDVNLEDLREIVESPYPPQWDNTTNQSGVTSEQLTITTERDGDNIVDAADDWDSQRVLMHEPEQWELEGYGWPRDGTVSLPQGDLVPPQVVVPADERPVFSCWEPIDGFVDGFTEDNFGAELANIKKAGCDEITVERLDPTGSVDNTERYTPTRDIRVQRGFTDITGIGDPEYYRTARPDLEPGFYRVYPDDNQEAAMTYAVAPNGNPERIANRILNVTNSEIDARTAYQQEIQEQHDAGNIDIKTTTTNDRGEFSFEIDDTVVEEVELRAAKSGTGLEAQLASGELNRQQLADDFEDTVRGEFNTFDKSSVRFSEADVGTQEFGDVCRQMGSVADDLGAPYTGSASTEVPNPDVTITGQRAPIPEGTSQPVRQCAILNYAQQALEDPASLLPGLAGDIADMAQDELEGHYRNIVNLLKGNEELEAVVEDELGRDLPDDPSELNRDEIETVVRDGLDEVDNPDSGIDVGDDQEDSPVPDIPGTGDDGSDAPSVEDPVEEIDDRVNETISREWPITGVGNWSEAGLLIRIDYANGTSETLSRDSEYVTLDESITGPDTIRLEEYPFGTGDAAVANIRLDVSTPQGIGGEETPVRNPTFDGTVPGLDSIRLSDSAPGPSDAVTVGVTPAESSQFGQLQTVNVTGPQCSRSIQASDGDATFTTCGAGPHRVAATFTNADGVQFTEVLSVDAGNAAQARDPLIRGAAGPTGRFAVAANGLESGRIDVTAGTSEVILTGIVPADSDIPNRVKASTTGVDVARDATTTVRIRQGPNEQTIRDRIGVVLHTSAVGNESLLWRNGRPIRNPGDTASSSVEHFNDSTAIDTFTSDTATVRVEVDRDPSIFQEFRHSVQLRFSGIDIPFLSIQPTSWLTTLGSIGDGLPAPVQVGGGPLALLGGGVAAARRVGP